jgi:RNA-directed DNA polymerase
MSLATPDRIRTLQRKLYLKAKAELDYRFYLLHDKICRDDVLLHAYALVRANKGAPGVDGVSCAAIEAAGLESWLADIATELRTKTYQPQPVRRVTIPKPGGGERPLGIPTIRDRVVQTAAKLVLEPIFEADLEPSAYGYRPGRSGNDAVKAVHRLLCQGFTEVVDADLTKYFDTIPHDELLRSVATRIVERHVLRLIKLWLKAPVEETDPDGRRRMSGGRSSTCGTPQGGVISPLLANRYMNRFLRHWRGRGCAETFRAHVVTYADNFVILSRGHADEVLAWTRRVMAKLGLSMNEAKAPVRDARRERFDFLGYSLGPHHYRKDGHWYFGASPSRKSVQRLKERMGGILVASNTDPWDEVRDRLNRLLRGWAEYFSYGTRLMAYRAADHYVYATVRGFLTRRHKLPSRGTRQFSDHQVFGELGVLRLRRLHIGAPPTAAR